jgi:anti-anti-sigma regulatory factor
MLRITRAIGDDHTLVVTIHAASDQDAPIDVGDALAPLMRSPERRVVIDLTSVDLADADAFAILYDVARATRERDGLVALALPPRTELRSILHATGFEHAFSLYDSRRAALNDLGIADPGDGS